MQEEALHRLHILNDLRGALDAGQFQLYYQPIVEIGSGKIFKAEDCCAGSIPNAA